MKTKLYKKCKKGPTWTPKQIDKNIKSFERDIYKREEQIKALKQCLYLLNSNPSTRTNAVLVFDAIKDEIAELKEENGYDADEIRCLKNIKKDMKEVAQ